MPPPPTGVVFAPLYTLIVEEQLLAWADVPARIDPNAVVPVDHQD
jgi:hypothetical protein